MIPNGLLGEEARRRFAAYGPNEIPEKKQGFFLKAAKWFASPIALMLLGAAFLSLIAGKTFDFYFILLLTFINFGVSFWQERKADNAIQKLRESLAIQVKVLRDGAWISVPSREMVPGDVFEVSVGDLIPADAALFETHNLSVNEAALTGESLPKDKQIGDSVFSGTFVTTGLGRASVTATGAKTSFGRTVSLIEKVKRRSLLEEDILMISKFLMVVSLLGVLIISIFFFLNHVAWSDLLVLDLSLIIAGIPVSLPTVMTLIISLGVLELAKKKAVVRRLSALEDLANVDLLLTDKTGTLTMNRITVAKIIPLPGFSSEDVVFYASLAAPAESKSAIDQAVAKKAASFDLDRPAKIIDYTPADSERKRSTVLAEIGGTKTLISVGAPQIIEGLALPSATDRSFYETHVEEAARDGYRALGVAIKPGSAVESGLRLAGLLLLADPLDDDAGETIDFLEENGIGVKMLTGDNLAIARRTVDELGLQGMTLARDKVNWNAEDPRYLGSIGAFAEILPEDKFKLAKLAQAQGYIVAMTGDGVNDLGAIKAVNVGIAVKNAVDALKSAADIVLFSQGLSVIRDALIEARKIFARLYSYSLYRLSESFRLIITVVVLGFISRAYPLTPLQLILIALLNDIPTVALAFDRVEVAPRPAKVKPTARFALSSLYGLAGIGNSLILFFLMTSVFHLSWGIIQTVYFLKLTVSGQMLIYVAHTKERWWKYLPSRQVIWAITGVQLVATVFAIFGILMPAIPVLYVVAVWVWCFIWLQITELTKVLDQKVIVPRFEK
ncbi:plasma-membrane proton-efflux P-type ATPase [Patescibacteria group bacterium]|nr:plasma-membrane proton-efflux P-type ATPase [Patescibacteria group bacterium]